MRRSAELRSEGYDTVVAAPFDEPKAHGKALEQLAEFRPDFLLFVDALDEIILEADDGTFRRWTKRPGKGRPDYA